MLMTEDLQIVSPHTEEEKPFDPYCYRAEMPLTAVYFPLGFPLQLRTNSPAVIEAAEESWGHSKQQFEVPPLRIQVGVMDDGSTECPPAPVARAQQNLLVSMSGTGNFLASDLTQGFTFAWFAKAAVSHRSYFRFHFLDAMALFHIANRYTVPIHAACIGLNGHGVMLCGNSGVGKSSLSFACARAGWTYITDDASFLLQGRDDRQVIGHCHTIRLRPSAAALFEEVVGKPVAPRTKGKPSIELLTSTIPGITTATSAEVDYIVFLNRRDANVQELVPFPKEPVRRYVDKHLSGVEEMRRNQIASVDRLLTAEIFELRYRDMNWAIDRLERMVRERG
jgi:hypothetical protein